MNISNGLMILAVFTAPFFAVFAQRKIDENKERRGKNCGFFAALMATRGNKISLEHVQALNMIDLFFDKKGKEKAIIEKWDEYLDHLNDPIKDDDENYQIKLEQWTIKSDDILADMLQLMGKSIGYDFDKVRIRKAIYVPRGHGDVDLENRVIRRGIAEIVIGRKSLPVRVSESVQNIPGSAN